MLLTPLASSVSAQFNQSLIQMTPFSVYHRISNQIFAYIEHYHNIFSANLCISENKGLFYILNYRKRK
jgi:hypothetical protein